MVLSLSAISEPIGSVKSWLRADNTVPIPTGWLICDGSTVVDATSFYNGKALPDFRGRFVRGHNSLDNSNFGADAVYYAGGTIPNGGADSNNVAHAHNGDSHFHQVSIGAFSMPAAGGTLATDNSGTHQHSLQLAGATTSLAGPGNPVNTENSGAHSHLVNSGRTGSNDTNFNSDATSANTDSQLGVIDNRPAYRELVVIIKIK